MAMKKIFIVVNVEWFFLSHRLPIALEAVKRNYDVTILAIEEENRGDEIRQYGLKFIPLPATRGGSNIFSELALLRFLYKLYKKEKPDIVHHVAIKPILYGSIAARLTRVPRIVNAISGLGTVFMRQENFSIWNSFIRQFYKFTIKGKSIKIIVQNQDDLHFIRSIPGIQHYQVFLIKGSGVDLNEFAFSPPGHEKPLQVVMASRMLYDKGIKELIEAARMIKSGNNKEVEFILAGKLDAENVSGIPEEILKQWTDEGIIKWVGHQASISALYRRSAIVVLPSYREGFPKALIEACAVGRPIVTTNVPGCREVVDHGENGFVVEKGNVHQLAEAILVLLEDQALRESMGLKSREIAEREYSIHQVVEKTFAIYEGP
jgi:glycosyltransferase involved in cell wall biosynthesis